MHVIRSYFNLLVSMVTSPVPLLLEVLISRYRLRVCESASYTNKFKGSYVGSAQEVWLISL
jgi:hypothetical protein